MTDRQIILIVDDTPENLQVLGDILGEKYEVRIATNGPDALNIVKSSAPDLILLDIMMPGMGGNEVCRQLKADPDSKGIPLIFISAIDASSQKIQAFREGAVDYVTKPFQAEEVAARVHTHLQLSKLEDLKREMAERKQAEAALKESEQRFRRIVQSSPMGIHLYEMNAEGKLILIDANPAADHYMGTRTADLFGRPIEEAFPGLIGTDIPFCYIQVATGQLPSFQLTGLEYHDKRIHGIFDIHLFQSNPGRMVAMFAEVTERIRAEQEREHLLKALQLKTDELESIIYVSSHDLRSPLVNIQGFSGELNESCRQIRKILDGNSDPQSRQRRLDELIDREIPSALDFITSSVRKLDTLQKGLLKICRIGRDSLEIAPVAMNELIDGVLKSTRYQLDDCQAQVTVEPLPDCRADAAQLTQVFTNLIDNAIKYRSPDRSLVVRIYGRVENGRCVYAVADNGIGIAPEHQKKVFEMFHQLDPLNGHGGEGLGLTIVKRILGRMEGEVRLESAPGVGSIFSAFLPKA